MAGQDTIEELTHGDLADLPECVCNRWVFTDEPRRERPFWHDNLSWTDFYDLEVLAGMGNFERSGGMMPTPNEFSRIDFARAPRSQDASEPEASNFGPYPGADLVPPETRSDAQFSSDTSGDPRDLLAQTEAGVKAHADMNLAYGLTQPVATLGSHPWLRDSLADPSPSEPGNAVPNEGRGVPLQRTLPNK